MLRRINPFLPYAASGLVLIGLGWVSFSLNQQTKAIEPAANQAFEKCYPSTYEEPITVKSLPVGTTTVWEIEAYSHDQSVTEPQLLHFKTKLDGLRTRCAWLNRHQRAFRLDYFKKDVAIALAKQQYETPLSQCISQSNDIEGCRGQLIESLSGTRQSPEILFPEDIHALKQLNVDVNLLRRVRLLQSPSRN